MLFFGTASAQQAIQTSRTFENVQITLTGGAITTQHFGGEPFFWKGAENTLNGVRHFAGLEIAKYVVPAVGFGLEGLAMFRTTDTNTAVSQSNVIGNVKLNLSNWFGGYPGKPRRVEVVFVPGIGWGHDYGDIYNDRNYLTYNLGAELNVNLGQARAWQINIKPVVVWNNYNNTLRPLKENMQGRFQVGVTYKFGSRRLGSHNFIYSPFTVTTDDYREILNKAKTYENNYQEAVQVSQGLETENRDLKDKIQELENRKPAVDTVEVTLTNVTVYFDKGKYAISNRELAHLDFYAQNADKNVPIRITGSADSATGSSRRNAYLAKQRALAVKKVLVEKYGFDENKITIDTAADLFDVNTRSRVAVVE